jgi:hypothetical protein
VKIGRDARGSRERRGKNQPAAIDIASQQPGFKAGREIYMSSDLQC